MKRGHVGVFGRMEAGFTEGRGGAWVVKGLVGCLSRAGLHEPHATVGSCFEVVQMRSEMFHLLPRSLSLFSPCSRHSRACRCCNHCGCILCYYSSFERVVTAGRNLDTDGGTNLCWACGCRIVVSVHPSSSFQTGRSVRTFGEKRLGSVGSRVALPV